MREMPRMLLIEDELEGGYLVANRVFFVCFCAHSARVFVG